MNGIKRSLLVSCLFLLVGSSIQQPLHTGGPGKKLQEIIALVSNNKAQLCRIVAMLMTVIDFSKWKHSNYQLGSYLFNREIEFSEVVADKLILRLDNDIIIFFHSLCCTLLFYGMKGKSMASYKVGLNLNFYIALILVIAIYVRCIKRSIKIPIRILKFRTFPNDDTKDTCLICKEEKKVSKLTSPCKTNKTHRYCKTCFELWYNNGEHDTCPLCQGQLTEEDTNFFEKLRFIFNKAKNGIKSKKGMLFCLFMVIDFTRLQTMRRLCLKTL